MAPRIQDDDDKPLDPAMERVRSKLVRLMVVSIGIMLIGLMAVLVAVVYKMPGGKTGPFVEGTDLVVDLPAGSEIVGTALDGDRALLTVRQNGVTDLVLVSLTDGSVLGRLQPRDGGKATDAR